MSLQGPSASICDDSNLQAGSSVPSGGRSDSIGQPASRVRPPQAKQQSNLAPQGVCDTYPLR